MSRPESKLKVSFSLRSAHRWALQHARVLPSIATEAALSRRSIMAMLWHGLQDLQECVDILQKDSTGIKDGMAPIYGLASVSPDRKIIGEFLVAYQDVLLSG